MRIRYGLIEETYYFCASKGRIAYGMVVYEDEDLEETATVIVSVNDICCNKEKIKALIEKCNRLELSPIHLNDIIEDFFAQ